VVIIKTVTALASIFFLIVSGFGLIADADSGYDFQDSSKSKQAYSGLALIFLAFFIIGAFIYKAVK
jgi:hypothetical protein